MNRLESQTPILQILSEWFLGIRKKQTNGLSHLSRIQIFIILSFFSFTACWFFFDSSRSVYYQLLSGNAEILSRILGNKLEFSVQDQLIRFRCFQVPFFEADLSPSGLVANTTLFWALIIATPGMAFQRRLFSLLAGTFLLNLTQSTFLLVKVEIALITAQHPLAGSEFFWKFADDFFEISGKGFFPVLLWLMFGLKYMLGQSDIRRAEATVARNAPCPCGSGRKYKRCCGKDQSDKGTIRG